MKTFVREHLAGVVASLLLCAGAGGATERFKKIEQGCDDFSAWQGATTEWAIFGDAYLNQKNAKLLVVKPGTGVIVNGRKGESRALVSRAELGDIKAHIEFVIPENSNSGVYFSGQYELQIADSWGAKRPAYAGSECGGIYQRWDKNRNPKGFEGHSPLVNASRPPGQWQSFDVIFRAARFDEAGKKISNARFVKVEQNGTVIHKDVELRGPTRGSMYEKERGKGPLVLQGDHGPVAYRNIRIEPFDTEKSGLRNAFFAMDTGTVSARYRTAREQVEMLKELGYTGIGYWPGNPNQGENKLSDFLTELDRHELGIFPVYFTISVEGRSEQQLASITKAIRLLGRRGGTIWLAITSERYRRSSVTGDVGAVEIVRTIADMAQESGVNVALYPHVDFWLERVEDAVRVAEKANRRNVGVTFNLYHWLRTDRRRDAGRVLQRALPYLFVVTINGSSNEGSIETLDKGAFEVYGFLKELKSLGYNGPIGLQGYGIEGDAYENLKRSMDAWRGFSERMALEEIEDL